ncbi:hypothetical protein [Nocardia nova]|uniref:hypothetical protein n=1 Tax=Nocardia nova TaxID=37330 RepID=UPI0033C39736
MPSLLYPTWIAEYTAILTELTGRTWTRLAPTEVPAPGDTAEWIHDKHGALLRLCAYLAPSEFGDTTFAERILITAEIAPGRPRPHPHGHAITAPLHHTATAAAITHHELLAPHHTEKPRSNWENDTSPDEIADQLTELAERNGTASEDLDDLVHDTASLEASQANNNGLTAQLQLLLRHLSAAEITEHLHPTNNH